MTDAVADHHGVGAEFLAERHRHGVLVFRAPHLEHIGEFGGLSFEAGLEFAQRGDGVAQGEHDAELDRGRIGVVGGLRAIDVVVRVEILVFAFAVAEQFERAVGDDLVGVHVRRGARAALDHVHGKLFVQLAGDDFVARGRDGVRALRIEHAEFGVRAAAAFFTNASARTKCSKCRNGMPESGKFSMPRRVCTP